GSSAGGATVTVFDSALTQVPVFVTGSCRLAYTAPDVGAVTPSTGVTARSIGASPVLVTITTSLNVWPGATVGLKYALVDGSAGSACPGRRAIPKLAEAGGAGNQASPATSAETSGTARPRRRSVRLTITF